MAAPIPVGSGTFLRDVRTGAPQPARYIDPVKRDYVLDPITGRLVGMSYVRQCVQLAIATEQGSCAMTSLGHRLRSLKIITVGFERTVLSVLTEAVQHLISAGLIEVVSFKNYTAGDGTNGLRRGSIYGVFEWRDLSTQQVYQEQI